MRGTTVRHGLREHERSSYGRIHQDDRTQDCRSDSMCGKNRSHHRRSGRRIMRTSLQIRLRPRPRIPDSGRLA